MTDYCTQPDRNQYRHLCRECHRADWPRAIAFGIAVVFGVWVYLTVWEWIF